MQLPYAEPLTVREPGERVVPEPPRRGEEGGEPCGICAGQSTAAVWQDEHFSLHPPVGGSIAGAVWLASREHVDSFSDLSPEAAAAFGPLAARVERAILGLGDVGRVHLYRWGDGGAHFHVWFIPRPLGMLEASGMMLPLWEDVLPNVTDDELRGRRQADRRSALTTLARRLGTFDAVVIGLGSMIGAGVFAAFAPAAASAGSLLLVGLALAAGVAYCNAVASAQLAAQYPTSGGTYVYGRERLGEWWGFLAGWGFVIGKTASCAAMALTFAAYAVPGPRWVERLVAAVAVVTLTGVNLRGITRTAGLTRILVAVSLVALARRGRRDPRERRRQDGQPDVGASQRALRRAPVGGAPLLRVRGLREDRDARRGGTRTAADDPACDPTGARDHRRRLRGRRRVGAARARPGCAGGERDAARERGPRRSARTGPFRWSTSEPRSRAWARCWR